MNYSETLSELFKQGCVEVTIGVPPQHQPPFFMRAKQGIVTGDASMIEAVHQTVGENVAECINLMAEQVKKANELRSEPSGIVKLPRNGR